MTSYIRVLLLLLLVFQHSQCTMGMMGLQIPPEPISLNDITRDTLVHDVSQLLNTTYLSVFQGQIFGSGTRLFINLPVRLKRQDCPTKINVIFKVDTGVPISTLSSQTLQVLYNHCKGKVTPNNKRIYTVLISGEEITVSQSQAHFQTLNILGGDFLKQIGARLIVDYQNTDWLGSFQLMFQANQPKKGQSSIRT